MRKPNYSIGSKGAKFRDEAGIYFWGVHDGAGMMGDFEEEYLADDAGFIRFAMKQLGLTEEEAQDAYDAGVAWWRNCDGEELERLLIDEMVMAYDAKVSREN